MRHELKMISTAILASAFAVAAAAQATVNQGNASMPANSSSAQNSAQQSNYPQGSNSSSPMNPNSNMNNPNVSSNGPVSTGSNGQYRVGNRGISEAGEQRLVREIRHELLMQPYYSVFDDVEFQVSGNNVTLLGKVVNPTLKKDAENSVKHIEGVEHVDNRIDILPPSPMDDQIRIQAYRAIYGYDGLFKYANGAVPPIHIIVQNGRITLTGVVDNEADKNLAYMRASGIPNVFQVTNDLQVVKG